MSNPKITPKNLSYDSSLPPFLQRLHNSSTSASLDGRHERAIARPRKARDADADKEDEPVFVNEETGEVISAEEVRKLGDRGERESKPAEPAGDDEVILEDKTQAKGEGREEKKHRATIGASRKRKVAKVVGGSDSGEDRNTVIANLSAKKKKAKEKGKKVKLSFGDDG